jgi:hypothetical protein
MDTHKSQFDNESLLSSLTEEECAEPLAIRVPLSESYPWRSMKKLQEKVNRLLDCKAEIALVVKAWSLLAPSNPGFANVCFKTIKNRKWIGLTQGWVFLLLRSHEADYLKEMKATVEGITGLRILCTPKLILGYLGEGNFAETQYLRKPIPLDSEKAVNYRLWTTSEMAAFLVAEAEPIVRQFLAGIGEADAKKHVYQLGSIGETVAVWHGKGFQILRIGMFNHGFQKMLIVREMRIVIDLENKKLWKKELAEALSGLGSTPWDFS